MRCRNTVYLDGNSLGRCRRGRGAGGGNHVQQQWGEDLISGWNGHRWIDLPQTVGEKVRRWSALRQAGDLCGLHIGQPVQAAGSGLMQRPMWVLSAADNFPTDLYIAGGFRVCWGMRYSLVQVAEADIVEP